MALKVETGKNNPVLRTVCEPITRSEWKAYVKLGKQMLEYIKNPDHAGVGLAAPQIGVTKRIAIVSLLHNWDDENFSTVMMINPEVLEASDKMIEEIEEGCLSLPKTKKGFVSRHQSIKLRYFDEKQKEKTLRLTGLASVIVQHEIDHLDGVLYIDKLVK